jgi:hypothetical protein
MDVLVRDAMRGDVPMTHTPHQTLRGPARRTATALSRGAAVVALAAAFVIASVIAPAGALAQGTAWYVGPTGDDAAPGTAAQPFATIQHAITASADGDSVMLADGEYSGPGNRDIDMQGKAIRVASISMDPLLCVINCADPDSTPHLGFIFNGFYNDRPELAGLTVTGATALLWNEGAIQLPDDGSVVDKANAPASAADLERAKRVTGAAPILRRMHVVGNTGNGFYVGEWRTVFTAYECEFSGNTGHGGATRNWSLRGDFYDCRFERNGASGLSYSSQIWGPPFIEMSRCRFNKNGGHGFETGIPDLQIVDFTDCEFIENGLNGVNNACIANFRNSVFADNSGWGLYQIVTNNDPGTITVDGCEIAGNQQGGIHTHAFGAFMGGANIHATLVADNGGPGIVGIMNTFAHAITDCQIVNNSGPAVVVRHSVHADFPSPTHSRFSIDRTTIAANGGPGLVVRIPEEPTANVRTYSLDIAESIICHQDTSASFVGLLPDTLTVACTDVFGHDSGNWTGPLAPFANQNGNLSVDPLFCADANPTDPWTLHADSPLAAENNATCGQIGARGAACASTVVACRSIHIYDPVTGAYDPNQLNRVVTVEGVVYVAPGTYSDTGGGYLQDETGGINFWRSPVPESIHVGDRLRITGPIWPWLGELHIGTYTYAKLDSAQSCAPTTLTLASLLGDFANTGSHVRVIGTVTDMTLDSFLLRDGALSVEVRRNAFGNVDFSALQMGRSYAVDSPCFKEEGALYLMPAAQADIVPQSSWYVATDGDDANAGTAAQPFATIQRAITASADGDSVMLADGEYSGPGNRDIDMQGKAIRVASISMEPEQCVINCADPDATPHLGFIFNGFYTGRPELAGLTVTGATALAGNEGAIQLPDDGSVVDKSNAPADAANLERAMKVTGAAPILRRMHVVGNTGNGFYVGYRRTVFSAYECEFSGNTGNGGVTRDEMTFAGEFYDCRFNGNGEAGLIHGAYNGGPEPANFHRCQFNSNGEDGFAATQTLWQQIEFVDCEFIGNGGNGALCIYTSTFINCIFADNGGWGLHHAIFIVDPSTMEVTQCEVVNNGLGGIRSKFRSGNSIAGGANVTETTVSNNGGPGIVNIANMSPKTISSCVVIDNEGPGIILYADIPSGYPFPANGRCNVTGNTIAANGGPGLVFHFPEEPEQEVVTYALAIDHSIICQQDTSASFVGLLPDTLTVACTDIFNNASGDWTGPLASFANTAGNLSVDPEFCAPDTGDYHLQADSPLAAANNIVCGTIGRLDVNCPADPGSSGVNDLPATAFVVAQNVPNPFNPFTTIRFNLPASAPVTAGVFDLAGRRIRALVSGVTMGAGPHELTWDGHDDAGRQAPSGSYHFRLEAAGESRTVRMMLLK